MRELTTRLSAHQLNVFLQLKFSFEERLFRKYVLNYIIIIIILLLAPILNSCSKKSDNPVVETGACNLRLDGQFTYDVSETLKVSTEIGFWMFCEQNLSENSIADWNGEPYEGKRLLEPINVIWLDFKANDANEAQSNLWDYLAACGFHQEHAYHSGPYHAKYKTLWLSQDLIPQTTEVCSRSGNKAAWTDLFFPAANNHGRIFPSYPLDNGGYITLGAFSREGNALSGHAFISFDEARNQLNKEVAGWEQRGVIDIGNFYPPNLDCDFTTSDKHSGTRVIVQLRSSSEFARTSSAFPWNTSDFDCECEQEFGSGYRIADWNEVVTFINTHGFDEFYSQTGMTSYRSNGWVTREGQHLWSTNRHYFIERHDGNVPSGWLVHTSIGSNIIDLGSWYNSRPILCYKP